MTTMWSKKERRAAILVIAVPTPPAPTSSTRMPDVPFVRETGGL
ncbi:hypothetical protein ACIBUR_30635 [Streptomyces anulatus]